MKAHKLTVKNIGIIGNIELDINKPLIIFYGDIQQGKTTILNSIKLLFGGGFSNDLIKHGEIEAFVNLDVDNGSIRREWYINKDGKVVSRPLQFIQDGKLVKNPVSEISKYINPFQLDQNHLKHMNKIDRNNFLLSLFDVDTSDLDEKKKLLEEEAKELRIKIKMYGDIDLTEVQSPDIEGLQKEEKAIRDQLNKDYIANKKHNDDLRLKYKSDIEKETIDHQKFNEKQVQKTHNYDDANDALSKLKSVGYQGNDVAEFILSMPQPEKQKLTSEIKEPDFIPEMPDQTKLNDLLTKISDAKADKVKYNNHLENIKKQKQKDDDIFSLKEKELKIRNIKSESTKRLSTISDKIKGLTFDDNGDFIFKNTASDMLSDSQVSELSSKLSALYPDGLKLELIDQGESLGFHKVENIQKLIDHAKTNTRNILVTKVGDKDAKIPDDVGVFIVENGNINS